MTIKVEDDGGNVNHNVVNVTFVGEKKAKVEPVINVTLEAKERSGSTLFAKVKSLDQFGELVLVFNHPMKTDFNLTFLNSSISTVGRNNNFTNNSDISSKYKNILDIYVAPNDEWNVYTEGFEMQQINLTWWVTNFTQDEMRIQLKFNNVTYLSPNTVQDLLMIYFESNQSIFR